MGMRGIQVCEYAKNAFFLIKILLQLNIIKRRLTVYLNVEKLTDFRTVKNQLNMPKKKP